MQNASRGKSDYFHDLKKSYLNTEAQIVTQILNEYIQEGHFQKNILPKKIKGGDEIIWRPRFPPHPFFLFFLQSSKKRNLFLPSSLNWMQFIAFSKLVFHRQWQPMRICLLNVASGANMRKMTGGDAVRGMLAKTNP